MGRVEYNIGLTSNKKKHYLRDKEEIDRAISEVLSRGAFVMGREATEFESAFARYCDTEYSVAVTSGTSSLFLALLAAGVGPGDEVLTVANGDKAPSLAVLHTGAKLTWVDIDETTYNMDPKDLAAKLTDKTRAVIVVHMYGLPADMDSIMDVLADREDIVLIEDGSLATGALYKGKKVGSFGDMGCFSLASSKVLGVLGSGGAVCTNCKEYYLKLNQVRNYGGTDSPYLEVDPLAEYDLPHDMSSKGLNDRMDTIQAAAGLVKLREHERDLARRRAIAAIYDQALADSACTITKVPAHSTHSYRVYPLRVDPTIRDEVLKELRVAGIQAGTHYVPPDHLTTYFKKRGFKRGDLPATEAVADSIACLPSHPYMEVDEVWHVATKTHEILDRLT